MSRLEPLIDRPASPRATAARAFYLVGVSLHALDGREEAMRAWEVGARSAGPFADPSREKLVRRREAATA